MSNYIKLFSFVLLGLFIGSCQDDDSDFDLFTLRHDGENATAPALPIGDYEAGAHFTAADVANHPQTELIAIEYFVQDRPASAEILVSASTGGNAPGNIMFSRDVSTEIVPFSWNRVDLGSPIPLNNGLWLSMAFTNNVDNLQVMGCDGGPRNANGDWLFDSFDGNWLTYQNRTGESINWNIRGILQDR